nr:PREDICTED: forkhead box protein O1-like [Macaca fascicularis]
MSPLPQMPVQTLQDHKSSCGAVSPCSCAAGLLEELLTPDSPPHNDIIDGGQPLHTCGYFCQHDTSRSWGSPTQQPGSGLMVMGLHSVMSTYGSQASHNKMMPPSSHTHPGHAQQTSAGDGRALPHMGNIKPHTSGMNHLTPEETPLPVPLPHPMQTSALGATPP